MKLIICILGLTAMALAEDELKLLKKSNDEFTAKMFYEVATTEKNVGKSVVLSAFSVLPPLAQLALASVGESHDELLNAIGLPNDNVTKSTFSQINSQLRSVKGVELRMANRIYIAQDAALNPQFAEVSRNVFNSDVKNVDFAMPATVDEINAWVEDNTNNKIRHLLDKTSVDSTTRAVLVNAIYFKGLWKNKFDKLLTTDKNFHVGGQAIKVPTMNIRKEFLYGESAELDAKLLEMPYEGGEASFLIVLPNQMDGITQLQEKLKDASLLEKAMTSLSSNEVDVMLPKFKIETTTDLKMILEKMHITKMFSESEAKLNNLLKMESNLFISGAVQKAFIEVNEEGAEAAAANAFFMNRSAKVLPPELRKNFIADHPFYYALKNKSYKLFSEFGISYLSAIMPERKSFKADHPFVFCLKEGSNILFSGVYRS